MNTLNNWSKGLTQINFNNLDLISPFYVNYKDHSIGFIYRDGSCVSFKVKNEMIKMVERVWTILDKVSQGENHCLWVTKESILRDTRKND